MSKIVFDVGPPPRTPDVLLVEDDPGDARLTLEALGECEVRANLHVVEDGETAISYLHKKDKYVKANRPDLILLDLNLPRMDGHQVLNKVKNDANLCEIPVVILTTSQSPDDIAHAYGLHANCYVTKPMDLDGFSAAVRSVVRFWLKTVELPPEAR